MEGRRRWCTDCAKAHSGALVISLRKCETCKLKGSSFGMPPPAAPRRRWCGGCAEQVGAVAMTGPVNVQSMCEDCRGKKANFGLADGKGKKLRWCKDCSTNHEGAVSMEKKCEDCKIKACR